MILIDLEAVDGSHEVARCINLTPFYNPGDNGTVIWSLLRTYHETTVDKSGHLLGKFHAVF